LQPGISQRYQSAEEVFQDLDREAIQATTEDIVLGQAAEVALSQSKMVGTEAFTAALERLANAEA